MQIEIKKLSKDAVIPTKGSQYAAGYDLYAAEDGVVPESCRLLIKTNISVSIPAGCYGRIAPRSGLAYKSGIDVMAGVIDADYRGDIGVILYNTDVKDFEFKKGDRIAQLIIEKCYTTEWKEVEELHPSVRLGNGFGSTGL
tara:strand:+ start:214 stop:636 length:423 start_codon:yes stop_codon:yes gene_type:complete